MKKIKFHRQGKARQGISGTQVLPDSNTKFDYAEVFLRRKELKNRQSVYISKEIHASIVRLVHVLALAGKEISVGGYIDNVLAEHMESHKEVIADLFRQQLDTFL